MSTPTATLDAQRREIENRLRTWLPIVSVADERVGRERGIRPCEIYANARVSLKTATTYLKRMAERGDVRTAIAKRDEPDLAADLSRTICRVRRVRVYWIVRR